MKDLKYLKYFEDLLVDANNELVRQAKADSRIIIGNNCQQLPEVLLNLPGCTSVRMRAPGISSMEIGTYYMTSMTCEYCRALVERAFEGGFDFLDCIFDAYACSQMADVNDNIDKLGLCSKNNDRFFVARVDTPIKSNENAVRHMTRMCRARVLDRLDDEFDIDVSDDALREAVRQHNAMCKVINEIGDYRKLDCPTITGYEFAVICLVSYCAPHDLLMDKLIATAEELKSRKPDIEKQYRVKCVLVGSEVDDPNLIKLIEDAGALVVADRYCFGSLPGRREIILPEETTGNDDVLTAICRHYVDNCHCPRYMDRERIDQRKEYLNETTNEYHADGIIIQQVNFCNFWPYERAAISHVMPDEYGIPVLSIDRPYNVGSSGQLRTRVQAFIESIEIKQIRRSAGNE